MSIVRERRNSETSFMPPNDRDAPIRKLIPKPIKDMEGLVVYFFNLFNEKYMRYVPVTSLQYSEPSQRSKSVDQVQIQEKDIQNDQVLNNSTNINGTEIVAQDILVDYI